MESAKTTELCASTSIQQILDGLWECRKCGMVGTYNEVIEHLGNYKENMCPAGEPGGAKARHPGE
jgi:ribosomal protein L37AE/L43A